MLGTLPAKADPSQTVATLWQAYQDFCGAAYSDPQAMLDALPDKYPSGTYGTVISDDGKMFKINVSIGNQRYYATFERGVVGNRGHDNCSVTYSSYGTSDTFDEASAVAATENFLTATVGSEKFSGGRFPELYPDSAKGPDQLSTNPDNFQYIVADALPETGLLSYMQVLSGYMSIGTWKVVGNE